MGLCAAQHLAVQHVWEKNVVGKLILPGDARKAIDFRHRFADDVEAFGLVSRRLRRFGH